ncbi:TPA: DUF4935 domain-containing protein [Serratia rubidaea]|nr:DUF4935 domain-containing protein [Serratia rubidaea]HDJ1449713.1 DUF4935 domain-containing protein [Serratia rubidaea]HDJ1459992.1 DUF4935 domain-containing protein [Serratia rubidaea]HDJ2774731.1 DUF4935 domain-containing protein [Serratia rubidaea]
METKYVFIDTQSFVKAGLHFDNLPFNTFVKYCKAHELIHISTTVVEREVKGKIKESVGAALSSINTFRKKARILSSLDDERVRGLFEVVPDDYVYEKSVEVFDEFLNACSTQILDASTINTEEILSLYFDRKPPFSEGKKKSEFPDAISMLSLEEFLSEDEKIYIVSEDTDLISFCGSNEKFISVESLTKMLDIYTTFNNARIEQVKQYIIASEGSIKQMITQFLEECEVYNLSNWDGAEVDDGLTVLNLGEIEPSVLYIDDEQSQISFDIDVDFEVTVSGPDYINAIYDHEDGKLYAFDSTSRTCTINEKFTVELSLYYDSIEGRLENFWEDGLYIEGTAGGIEVSVEENEESDW